VQIAGHIMCSCASEMQNIDTQSFMLVWALCGSHKNYIGTHNAKPMFLDPVGSVGHMVCSIASGAQKIDAIIFMLGWAHCSAHKKHTRTRYAELLFLHLVGSAGHAVHSCVVGTKMSTHYFHACVGPVWIPQTGRQDTLRLCFCIQLDLWVT
jgi:hypothetical protein